MFRAFLRVTQVIVSGIRENVPVHFFYLFTDFLDPEFIGPYNVNLEEVIPIYCPRLENMTLDEETMARRIKAKELGLKFWTATDATINCPKPIPHEFVHSVYDDLPPQREEAQVGAPSFGRQQSSRSLA